VIEAARRQGIARALMNTASEWAKAQGADRLDLETARDNAPGQALYRDLGYELDEIFLKFSLDLSDYALRFVRPSPLYYGPSFSPRISPRPRA
jgi:ribosomal protein S18 acetylase RimI-like enzyme